MDRIDYVTHYHDSVLAHSSLDVHCNYRLKFFFAKNHPSSSSPSNCSLLGSRFA